MNIQFRQIMDAALETFGTKAVATSWLTQPSRLYNGDCPVDVINTPEGYQRACRQLAWVRNGGKSAHKIKPVRTQLNDLVDDSIMEAVLLSAGTGPEAFLEFCLDMGQRINKQIERSDPVNQFCVGHDHGTFKNRFCPTSDRMPLTAHF